MLAGFSGEGQADGEYEKKKKKGKRIILENHYLSVLKGNFLFFLFNGVGVWYMILPKSIRASYGAAGRGPRGAHRGPSKFHEKKIKNLIK